MQDQDINISRIWRVREMADREEERKRNEKQVKERERERKRDTFKYNKEASFH